MVKVEINIIHIYISVSLRLNVSNQVNLNYSTQVYFQANSDGRINLATDSPKCESYDKPDLMAIHWLMKPQEKSDSRFWPSKVENGLRCLYQVFDKENNKLAEEVVYKDFMSEGVERIELKVGRVHILCMFIITTIIHSDSAIVFIITKG